MILARFRADYYCRFEKVRLIVYPDFSTGICVFCAWMVTSRVDQCSVGMMVIVAHICVSHMADNHPDNRVLMYASWGIDSGKPTSGGEIATAVSTTTATLSRSYHISSQVSKRGWFLLLPPSGKDNFWELHHHGVPITR